MTSGWSLFIILVTLIYIVGCVWLLRWTAKPKSAGEKIGGGAGDVDDHQRNDE